MEKLRIVQIGCGKMSKYIMKYIYEKGADIVGAFDIDENIVGKDIGTIIGCENRNVIINNIDVLNEFLQKQKPDVAIVTTMSLIKDIHDVLRVCAKNGINTITTCEEAFYPKISNPQIYKELDVLAKANNCTITGCGYQDVFWGNLVSIIASSTHNINKIKGTSSYNVEDYGKALAKAHGAGLTIKEFDSSIAIVDKISDEKRKELIKNGEFLPSYMWNVVGWLADKLDLTITSLRQECIPEVSKNDMYSQTLDMEIKAGNVIGMKAVVLAKTEEGIEIEAECIGKIYNSEEFDVNEWTIYGNPDTTVTINKPQTVELTCANIVNRIPDLINSKPGFVPTCEMNEIKYRNKNLNEYIK